jgi:hypothetical protein
MTKYTEHELVIERQNEDGSISFIPKDPANSDYQAYLNPDKVEHLTEIVDSE